MDRLKQIEKQVSDIRYYKSMKRICETGMRKMGPEVIKEATERMSLRALAKRVGVSSAYLSRAVNGHVVLSKDTFLRIAKEIL